MKEGDNIKCIDNHFTHLTLDKTYKVLQSNGWYVYVKNDKDEVDCYFLDRFKLDIKTTRKEKLEKIYE